MRDELEFWDRLVVCHNNIDEGQHGICTGRFKADFRHVTVNGGRRKVFGASF